MTTYKIATCHNSLTNGEKAQHIPPQIPVFN